MKETGKNQDAQIHLVINLLKGFALKMFFFILFYYVNRYNTATKYKVNNKHMVAYVSVLNSDCSLKNELLF